MATFGNAGVHSFNIQFNSSGGNGKTVSLYTIPTDAYVYALNIRMQKTGTDRLAKAVIYSVSSGEPDILLASSEEVSVTNTGESAFKRFSFTNGVFLPVGDYYFGAITDTVDISNSVSFGTIGTTCETRYNNESYSDGASNPFGIASTSTAQEIVLFGEYLPYTQTAFFTA